MNTNSLSTRIVKVLSVVAVAVVFIISNPLASLANGGDKKINLNDEQVSVQYVGNNNDYVVFRVQFENPTAEKFWLLIKNDAGDVIYRKQFSDVHFAKSVSLQKEGVDMHPTFVIRNGNSEISRQFAVSSVITENTVITEL
ncbi:MAG TPA: hypothetical protein VL832_11910 [Puia sp.]|jgi:hypothetical protein|nr:hypothetical protein [Puia sp.]